MALFSKKYKTELTHNTRSQERCCPWLRWGPSEGVWGLDNPFLCCCCCSVSWCDCLLATCPLCENLSSFILMIWAIFWWVLYFNKIFTNKDGTMAVGILGVTAFSMPLSWVSHSACTGGPPPLGQSCLLEISLHQTYIDSFHPFPELDLCFQHSIIVFLVEHSL